MLESRRIKKAIANVKGGGRVMRRYRKSFADYLSSIQQDTTLKGDDAKKHSQKLINAQRHLLKILEVIDPKHMKMTPGGFKGYKRAFIDGIDERVKKKWVSSRGAVTNI